MSANHGNTPAAWTGVVLATAGFVVGAVALMLDPIVMTLFWVGVVMAVIAFPLFLVLNRTSLGAGGH